MQLLHSYLRERKEASAIVRGGSGKDLKQGDGSKGPGSSDWEGRIGFVFQLVMCLMYSRYLNVR